MERVDGWTKRQWRQCDNGWLHFYPDEDECSGLSSQTGSCLGPGMMPTEDSSWSLSLSPPHGPGHPSGAPLLPPKMIPLTLCNIPRLLLHQNKHQSAQNMLVSMEQLPALRRNPTGPMAAGRGRCPTAAPRLPGLFSLPRRSCSSLKKQERKNKSIRHEDKYAFHVAADSSGRAVVAA